MARLVKHAGKGPIRLKADEEIWICTCGLSEAFPFCDGSHKKTQDEAEGKLYVYDDKGRVEIG